MARRWISEFLFERSDIQEVTVRPLYFGSEGVVMTMARRDRAKIPMTAKRIFVRRFIRGEFNAGAVLSDDQFVWSESIPRVAGRSVSAIRSRLRFRAQAFEGRPIATTPTRGRV